jgi:hypothetical protein
MYLANNTRPDTAFAVNLPLDIVHPLPNAIGLESKIFFDTSMARQISVYSMEEIKILAS